jgi:hypothetical protein
MSADHLVKGDCRHCGGSLEFPAEDAGKMAECPLCGQPTELIPMVAQPGKHKSLKPLTVSLFIIGVILVGLAEMVAHFKHPQQPVSVISSSVLTNASKIEPSAAPPIEMPKPKPPPETETNDFAISPIKLEKTPGSSLVYVIGKLRNLSGQTRYGVKLEFGLSDTNHEPVGVATDYHQSLEPYGEWNFRAMVLESKAVSAHFRSVREDQ